MSTEENKALVRRYVEAINNHDTAVLNEVLSPDLAKMAIEKGMPWLYSTYGGHHIEITDMMAEGDKVWARLATSGRHTGEWLGLPATGRRWTNTGVYFVQVSEGRIIKSEGLFDLANLVKQLGATLTAVPQ